MGPFARSLACYAAWLACQVLVYTPVRWTTPDARTCGAVSLLGFRR